MKVTIEQLESLKIGDFVQHAIFGDCVVEGKDTFGNPLSFDLKIMSDEGKDIMEDWIRRGAYDEEINDERYYVFQEDEPLSEDGIIKIFK